MRDKITRCECKACAETMGEPLPNIAVSLAACCSSYRVKPRDRVRRLRSNNLNLFNHKWTTFYDGSKLYRIWTGSRLGWRVAVVV